MDRSSLQFVLNLSKMDRSSLQFVLNLSKMDGSSLNRLENSLPPFFLSRLQKPSDPIFRINNGYLKWHYIIHVFGKYLRLMHVVYITM